MDREALVKGMLNGRQSKYPLSAQTVPMNVALNSKTDPAMMWPGAPPNWGQPDMPHIFSFVGRYGMVANAYMHADEALMHSSANAEIMRNEPMIMECIEARMRCVALLNWHIQPVDNDVLRDALDKADSQETAMRIRAALKKPKSDAEVIADKLTSILKHTPHFMKMRYSLMDAIWYGKTATVQTMGVRPIGGQRRIFVRKWEPRHGDKLIFRYADGSYEYDPDQVGIRIGPTTEAHDDKWIDYAGFERQRVDATQHGFVYWFDGQQRRRICLHKHIIEDGDFMRPEKAGSINGVGIRSRIYWTWWAYQESLKLLLEYVERSALGIEIWKYPAHDPKAKERTEKAAQERGAPGRSVVLVPIPTGEYGDMYGVQIVEPGLGGISELQSVLQTFFGHKIKRYILGQTLTSEAEATGMGSGVADAHLATFHDIVRFDGLNLEETITTDLLRPLQQWNFPGTDDIFLRFVIDTESPDAQERIASYQAAWAMGVKIRTEDIYDALGASPPTEGDDYLDNPGLEAARISNEAQKQQIAQQAMMMQAQMGGGPQQFVPFPNLEGGGGVPGDGDGDGLVNDDESQQFDDRQMAFQSNAKVERYAADHKFVHNIKDEHHQAIGHALGAVNEKGSAALFHPNFRQKLGLTDDHVLTHDDQHMILWHAGLLDDPHVGKRLFGEHYKGEDAGTVPHMTLGEFIPAAHKAVKEGGQAGRREQAAQRLQGAKVVSFKNDSGGRLVLHPAVRKDATSKWQLTQMSSHDGKPWGHENPPSFEHGWQNAIGVSDKHLDNWHGYEIEWTDKDGTKAPFAADGDVWHTIERFGRYKPMQGQGSFDWNEEDHPREQEAHDGKRPGEFAKKEKSTEPNPRAWTNNGDGTYTSPNGTIWRKAKAGGETSPVTGGQFKGGALMPIHGLATGLPKPEPKPKRDKDLGQSKVDEDGRQKDDWKEPKVRQMTPEQIEREKEKRERQRKWDEINSGIIGKALGLGDRPHHINRGWGIAKVWMAEAERIGPEATKKLVDAAKKVALKGYTELWRQKGEANPEAAAQETLDWRRANWQERLLTQGDVFTKKHKAKNPHTPELQHYAELALEGAGNQIDNLYEIHKALGEAEKHSAQAEVDRYGKVKPMAGQTAFNFDRQEPNKQAEPQPAPETEPEPTHPLAIKLKKYLELKDKAVRAGLKEPRTDLLK
jgi:phage gp29-like protein